MSIKLYVVYQGFEGIKGDRQDLGLQEPERVVDGFVLEGRAMEYVEDWAAEMETKLNPLEWNRYGERKPGHYGKVEYTNGRQKYWCSYGSKRFIEEKAEL